MQESENTLTEDPDVISHSILIGKESVYGDYSVSKGKYECQKDSYDYESLGLAFEGMVDEVFSVAKGWVFVSSRFAQNSDADVYVENTLYEITLGELDNDLVVSIYAKKMDDTETYIKAQNSLLSTARKVFNQLVNLKDGVFRVETGTGSKSFKDSYLAFPHNAIKAASINANEFF